MQAEKTTVVATNAVLKKKRKKRYMSSFECSGYKRANKQVKHDTPEKKRVIGDLADESLTWAVTGDLIGETSLYDLVYSMTKVKEAIARLEKVRKWVTATRQVTVLVKTTVCAEKKRFWQPMR